MHLVAYRWLHPSPSHSDSLMKTLDNVSVSPISPISKSYLNSELNEDNLSEGIMSSIKRHDLDLHISLPADAPAGNPHIIDFSHIDEDGPTDELHAVDAIATTLYKWNPEALQSLLEMK